MRIPGFDPARRAKRLAAREQVRQLAQDEFQYSRPKMVGAWAAAGAASAAAGVGIGQAWKALALPTNFGPAGMMIGGALGAAATYWALGDKTDRTVRLGVSAAVGVASAVAWHSLGLAGLQEGMGMAVGGAIGAYVGAKSAPEGSSWWEHAAAATYGVGICHVAGIVGATGSVAGMVGASLFPVLTGASGYLLSGVNIRGKVRELMHSAH
ncbi:MAG: hypothetical protein AB7S38_35855 [Vulcanimicrobiota bacterium]